MDGDSRQMCPTLPDAPTLVTRRVSLKNGDDYDVYIGRAGHGEDGYFGNPFPVAVYGRRVALSKYEASFNARVVEDAEFRKRVLELRGKRLACFCKPREDCHGDIIIAWLEKNPC
jgi:Domain of unknown function (DUF4326)